MLRPQRLIQLSVVGTILLSLLAIVYLFASKRFSKPRPPSAIVKHSVDTSSDEALKYWTADKMRAARAAELPNVTTAGRKKKRPRRPPRASQTKQAE